MQADRNTSRLHIHTLDTPAIILSKEAAADLLTAAHRLSGERTCMAALTTIRINSGKVAIPPWATASKTSEGKVTLTNTIKQIASKMVRFQ